MALKIELCMSKRLLWFLANNGDLYRWALCRWNDAYKMRNSHEMTQNPKKWYLRPLQMGE